MDKILELIKQSYVSVNKCNELDLQNTINEIDLIIKQISNYDVIDEMKLLELLCNKIVFKEYYRVNFHGKKINNEI